jgi:hypothetical protein
MSGKAARAAARGAEILSGYNHPKDWMDGAKAGRLELRTFRVLRVAEIQFGAHGDNDVQTVIENSDAICAWARSVGIGAKLSVAPHSYEPQYVQVPKIHWNVVLEKLMAL